MNKYALRTFSGNLGYQHWLFAKLWTSTHCVLFWVTLGSYIDLMMSIKKIRGKNLRIYSFLRISWEEITRRTNTHSEQIRKTKKYAHIWTIWIIWNSKEHNLKQSWIIQNSKEQISKHSELSETLKNRPRNTLNYLRI